MPLSRIVTPLLYNFLRFHLLFEMCLFVYIIYISLATSILCQHFFINEDLQNEMSLNVTCPKLVQCNSTWNHERKLIVNCSTVGCTQFPKGIPSHTSELFLNGNLLRELKNNAFKSLRELTRFSAQFNKISKIDGEVFRHLTKLTVLDLYGNRIVTLQDRLFSPLISLTAMNLGQNRIATFNQRALIGVNKLNELLLNMNSINEFPIFVYQNKSVTPALTHLDLDVNNIVLIPNDDSEIQLGLSNLTHLNICCNRITELTKHNLQQFPNLRSIKIHRNQLKSIDRLAFNSSKLEEINLKFSFISIGDIFRNVPNLRKLELTNNFASSPGKMFQNFSKLKHLDLGSTRVKFGVHTFLGTPLIEYLDMSSNAISELGSQYFEHLTHLKTLDLYGNQITTVNFTSLPSKLWSSLETIDLSLNPYICDCGLVWFRKWLHTTNVTIVRKGAKNYKFDCIAPSKYISVGIQNLTEPTELECFSSQPDWYLNSIVITLFSLGFSSLILSVIHRYRWHVRYWRFVYQKNRREQKELLDNRSYEYDAFIGYSEHDARWVTTQLIQNLEKKGHLRLCIHHRDWLCGRDIVDNVVDSLESSRKAMLVVSNAFAESQWCLFELTMAQSRMIREDRDNVILILLEDISSINMSPRLRHQMERQTYIEWTNNTAGQQLFWARLKQALCRPASSVFHTPTPFSTI